MIDKKQQEVLDQFFREYFTWDMANVGFWIVTGFMEFILGIFMFFPAEELGELKGFAFAMSIWGAGWYIMAYLKIRDNGKPCRVYEKLKYLPVTLRQIRLFRLRKLVVFSAKVTAVFLVAQLISAFCTHEFSMATILYPVCLGFFFPVIIVGSIAWLTK